MGQKVELFVYVNSRIVRLEATEQVAKHLQSIEGLEFLPDTGETRRDAKEPTDEDYYVLLGIAVIEPAWHQVGSTADDPNALSFEDLILPSFAPLPRPA